MSENSCDKAVSTELVVAEILKKTGNTRYFLTASFLNKFWNSIAKVPAILSTIVNQNERCFVGFLCEYQQDGQRQLILVTPPAAPADDPTWFMRDRFFPGSLYGKLIMGTHGGCVISRIESGTRQGKLYISRPYGLKPGAYKLAVSRRIPAMIHIVEDNILGQFAVLPPDNGPEGGRAVVFVKDYSRPFARIHAGARFTPAGRVRLHVIVFDNNDWVPHIFDPLVPPSVVTFQRSPYSVLAGSRLYMMYLVDLIAWFDLEEGSFGTVPLPGQMGTEVMGCLEYTGGPHPQGDLAIVHLDDGWLVRWVLTRNGDMISWSVEVSVNLGAAFGNLMNTDIIDALAVHPSEWHAVQVRSVYADGRYVLISVGIYYGLYVVDMVKRTVGAAPNLGQMGRVFPISQTWPPRP